MTRVLPLAFALCIASAVPLVAETARAQVSDADRTAARDLYNQGWSLQQAGRYADALDRYQRSVAVFPAPTTAFRIAQCKEALGKLVEAAEDLRAITHAALPAGSPSAFVTAQRDATSELAAVEPRIPKVTINVNPPGLQGLVVTIDGATMPNALVGVPRPVDPGKHTITATAPGYATAQQEVEVRERQQPVPEVTLTLQAGGAGYDQNQGNQGPGSGYQAGGYPSGGNGPYGRWVPPQRRPETPSSAFVLGLDVAGVVPFGAWASNSAGDLTQDLAAVGLGIGVEAGLRLLRYMYLGLVVQPTFFHNQFGDDGSGVSVAGLLGFMSNPDGLGFYGEIGGGFRYFQGTKDASGSATPVNASGGEAILGIGLQFKLGALRFIPKFEVCFGSHNDNIVGDDPNGHVVLNFALSGYWELPFAVHHAAPAAAPPAAAPAD